MYKDRRNVNQVKIVYFSGTGNTERAADCFDKCFKEHNVEVLKCQLRDGQKLSHEKEDMLVILYPVHACNAPEPIYKWIESTPNVDKIPVAVIPVSGGGEIPPNTACRVGCIHRLEKKGYEVVYEKMIVMPSNWIVATAEPLAVGLLEVLPLKVEVIVQDLLSGIVHRIKPKLIDRFFSAMGELEKTGAKSFGKKIRVSNDCNGCGLCERNCPAGNIGLEKGRPVFTNKCTLCLKCIYGCPNKALNPGFIKFIMIKDGYDLKAIEKRMPYTEPFDIEKLAKGYLWKGVREYLLDTDIEKI